MQLQPPALLNLKILNLLQLQAVDLYNADCAELVAALKAGNTCYVVRGRLVDWRGAPFEL